jgi:hypothetical protein
LLNAFAPKQAPTNFGLDALYVVTDATPPAPPPLLGITAEPSTRTARLMWQGLGRVFQVERGDVVNGPYQPLSPILPELFFDDLETLTNRAQSYYRLRQW